MNNNKAQYNSPVFRGAGEIKPHRTPQTLSSFYRARFQMYYDSIPLGHLYLQKLALRVFHSAYLERTNIWKATTYCA